ncbi:MAG: cytochrome c biogenesis protein CcsA [Deltaproteobacteria bacterium]|nr:cytochrome c biogenesis protein CcsA [Deltaproteobacteria bacterium]
MATALVHVALLAYIAAAVVYLTWLVRPREALVGPGRYLLLGGLVAHLGSFPALWLASAGPRVWTAGHLFSLLAAATVAAYLLLDWKYRVPVAGAFAAPLTVAAMIPAHLVPTQAREVAPGIAHLFLLPLHVGSAVAGSVAVSLAFVLAVVYLASERRLKKKQATWLLARLPSLELIDRLGWRLAVWGFIFLSLTIATGSFVSRAQTGTLLPFAAKQAFALLAWGLLAVLIQARLVAGWRGRRVSWLVVIGFVFLVGSYAGLLSQEQAPPAATVSLGERP